MSEFSDKKFNASGYSKSRPSYNDEFYSQLGKYIKDKNWNQARLLDVGCGPGTATLQLQNYFKETFKGYVGIDISPVMVEKARNLSKSINFELSGYDDYKPKSKFQLITAAQCAHWFDSKTFQDKLINDYLAEDGVVALWGYCDPVIKEYPKMNKIYNDVCYSDEWMGPYWQQPGRNRLRNFLKDFEFDSDRFYDIKDVRFDTAKNMEQLTSKNSAYKPLIVSNVWTLQQYYDYMQTFSSLHSWRKDIQNKNKSDPCDYFISQLKVVYPNVTMHTKLTVYWNTFYKFAKLK